MFFCSIFLTHLADEDVAWTCLQVCKILVNCEAMPKLCKVAEPVPAIHPFGMLAGNQEGSERLSASFQGHKSQIT